MTTTSEDILAADQLACGRSVDELAQLVHRGADPESRLDAHQRGCPYCQAALQQLLTAKRAVRASARMPVHAPTRLRSRVMDRVARSTEDVWYTVQVTDGGTVRIAARTVAVVARETARTVPGVRVALGRSTYGPAADLVDRSTRSHRHPHAAVGVLGRTAVVELAIAVTYGDQVHVVARAVQRRVIEELNRALDLQAVTVNVTIDDVIVEASAQADSS